MARGRGLEERYGGGRIGGRREIGSGLLRTVSLPTSQRASYA